MLAGGPPCQPFSKAGRSRMRYLVQHGVREPHDRRRDLWRSYLEIVRLARPRAVIMENVPDMALDREMFILRTIVRRLEDWGYSVQERVVDTYRYGVPQFRQRLILVARAGGPRVRVARGVREEGHAGQRDPRPPAGRPQGRVASGREPRRLAQVRRAEDRVPARDAESRAGGTC